MDGNAKPGHWLRKNASIIFCAFFVIGFWLLDFPKPQFDDLFYTGAGFNLAGGGDLSNPWLERQMFPSHFFFVYPPINSYFFAGWLKLFSISRWSVTGFTDAADLITGLATIALLRRYQAAPVLEWLVPLGLLFTFAPIGLRPEALSIALTMLGFLLADGSSRRVAGFFFGSLLIFLGAICAPRMAVFSAVLACLAFWKAWQANKGDAGRGRIPGLWVGAGALAVLIFLILIHFRLGEFLAAFKFHASRVTGRLWPQLYDFVKGALGFLQLPLALVPVGLLIYLWKKPKTDLAIIGIVVAVGFPLAVVTRGIGHGTLWWAILMMLLLTGAAVKQMKACPKAGLIAVVALSLVMADRKYFGAVIGSVTGQIQNDPGDRLPEALALKSSAEHPLLVDSIVARYVFDYRLPPGTLDVQFGAPFPGSLPGVLRESEFKTNDVYLVGPETLAIFVVKTYLVQDLPMWSPLNRNTLRWYRHPRQVYIVRPQDCKGTRFPQP